MITSCFKCSLAANRKNIVYGIGSIPNQIMIIGEAPGNKEDTLGLPFVGKSGVFFRSHLKRIGLENAYITNMVKCRPINNATPNPENITICTKYFLNKELNAVKPKFIITVGKVATNFFIDGSMIQLSGNVYSIVMKHINHLGASIISDVYILPLYHPSYILRNNLIHIFESDINKIQSYILRL